MKARTRSQSRRWLLVLLLFGILATAGLTLTSLHHRAGSSTEAHVPIASPDAGPPSRLALLSAPGDSQKLATPVGRSDQSPQDEAYSNPAQVDTSPSLHTPPTQSNVPASSNPPGSGVRPAATDPTVLPGGAAAGLTQSAPPSHSGPGGVSGAGDGDYAYLGGVPLVGGSGNAVSATAGVKPSSSSPAVVPPNPGSGQQRNNDSTSAQSNDTATVPPPSGDTITPPAQENASSESDPNIASAPELDPATLTAALTLLLGSLAVLGSRRARAPR
jgi:hypothetical protein